MTNRVKLSFKVKEYAPREVNGKLVPSPFILLETYSDLPGVAPGFMALDLMPNVSFEDAEEIARLLNEKVEYITHTPT
jgi:hypothetical protein